ncbi:MAG: DUF5946 family protein [Bdellovibrionota bacterium]
MSDRCSGCGMGIEGGTAGCGEIFNAFLERDFSDPAYFRYHRMVVDTYSLQHPDRYCASAKSLAAHLAGIYWMMEKSDARAVGSEALQRWLNGKSALVKPKLPAFRGKITIADVRAATPDQYGKAVETWARETWRAYASLHEVAREWIEAALAIK